WRGQLQFCICYTAKLSVSDTYCNSYPNTYGYRDALSRYRSGLCRRENYGRADHLGERRIQYGGNHGWAAGADDSLAELAAWLPGRLLDNGDRRQLAAPRQHLHARLCSDGRQRDDWRFYRARYDPKKGDYSRHWS